MVEIQFEPIIIIDHDGAFGDEAIKKEAEKFGAMCVLTDPNLPSGTDRIATALKEILKTQEKFYVADPTLRYAVLGILAAVVVWKYVNVLFWWTLPVTQFYK